MTPRRMDTAARLRRLRMILRRCRGMGEIASLVVEHLDRLEDKYGRATPSREGMAKAIGCCERSVTRAVRKLEAAGIIDVWRDKPHAVNGTWCRRRTNYYRLNWPPAANAQVSKRGHALHVYAFHEAIEPDGGVVRAAPTPSDVPVATLFDPDPVETVSPTEPPPVPPPWIAAGMDRTEWIRRCRT